jgi:CRISPR system Cascade subunit CasE
MNLHKLELNLKNKDTRRDVANPYEMHSTLCRAFSPSTEKCSPGSFLWRLEVSPSPTQQPFLLLQSAKTPLWENLPQGWLAEALPPKPIPVEWMQVGNRFRYRIKANPTFQNQGKRLACLTPSEQEAWWNRQAAGRGFSLLDRPNISQESWIRATKRDNKTKISLFSVVFDGYLTINDKEKFREALEAGIGRGKSLGCGMLSLARCA